MNAKLRVALAAVMSAISPCVYTCISGAQDVADSPAGREVDRIHRIWSGWAANIQSLSLEGYVFHGSFQANGPAFHRRELLELVDNTLLPSIGTGPHDIASLYSVTSPLFAKTKDPENPTRPVGNWRPYRFVQSGTSRRVDFELLGNPITLIRTESTEVEFNAANRQASYFDAPTGMLIEAIDDFVYSVKPASPTITWSLVRHPEGLCRLEFAKRILEYDASTGFIRHHLDRISEKRYLVERFQSNPIITPDAIPIARVAVSVTYHPGGGEATAAVKWLHIYVVDAVSINSEISMSRFAMSVPSGTNIVNFAGGAEGVKGGSDQARPPMERVIGDVRDVATHVAKSGFGTPRNAVAPDGTKGGPRAADTPHLWLARGGFLVVLCAGLLIAWWLTFRRRS